MKPINVIGLGYIGLPTALMLAANGVEVVGTDINQALVDKLNAGQLTFEENGLPELMEKASSKVKFSTVCADSGCYIIAVPTPYCADTKKIDAKYIVAAVKSVLEICSDGAIICVESTIAPGTIDEAVRPLVAASGKQVKLAHAPERVIPGNMVHELTNNSRTVGADDEETAERLVALYRTFCQSEIVTTDVKTAALSKVVENTYRDINIAFANELSRLCHFEGVDVRELVALANRHPRVNVHVPGPGVGGHCISVDPWFLVGDHPEVMTVVAASRAVNDGQPRYVFERLQAIMLTENITDFARVAFYGLTFKANVDDTRGSPGLQLFEEMQKDGICGATWYDPYVADKLVDGQVFTPDEFLANTDIVVILMPHDEIKENADALNGRVVFDTCDALGGDAGYVL
ncbi:MAG: nucleotide sugar dehydrogenase [Oscillospiraceae bacterium]|nr:nucleotide sugar dehydrogenase [Oscillospiraceae bacterium]